MSAFKGIQKYLIYACIAGWMFFLGIMVGRGTSPMNFDTREFSRKLEKMANIPEPENEIEKKIDLKFYEDLDHPATQERFTLNDQISADVPERKPETEPPKEPVKEPVKVIKKVLIKDLAKIAKKDPVKEIAREAAKPPEKSLIKEPEKETGGDKETLKAEKPVEPVAETLTPPKGAYTIQIAAYRSFQDAVSKMAALEEKGFSTYRIKGENEGTTWYRVRMGPFETYDGAKEFKARLDKAGIDAMIMKRETDEDIQE